MWRGFPPPNGRNDGGWPVCASTAGGANADAAWWFLTQDAAIEYVEKQSGDVVAEYKAKVGSIVDEYFSSADVHEACAGLHELENPLYQVRFLRVECASVLLLGFVCRSGVRSDPSGQVCECKCVCDRERVCKCVCEMVRWLADLVCNCPPLSI